MIHIVSILTHGLRGTSLQQYILICGVVLPYPILSYPILSYPIHLAICLQDTVVQENAELPPVPPSTVAGLGFTGVLEESQ